MLSVSASEPRAVRPPLDLLERVQLRSYRLLAQLGVNFHFNVMVDAAKLAQLEASYDAVFLGLLKGLLLLHALLVRSTVLTLAVRAA